MDSNIERIMTRVFYLKDPINKIKKEIKERAKKLTPDKKNGDYIQPLMDIGSKICLPKNPLCELCPVIKFCEAKKNASEDTVPLKIKKKIKPTRKGSVYWIVSSDNKVLLKRRVDSGILPGMLEFPSYGWSIDSNEDIDKKILFEEDRIKTFFLDQTNKNYIMKMWSQINKSNFDLIIDDGLHTYKAAIILFENSLQYLKSNGIYIIEDAQNSDLIEFKNYFDQKLSLYTYNIISLKKARNIKSNNNLIEIRKIFK